MTRPTLTSRAEQSDWINQAAGLHTSVGTWEQAHGDRRLQLTDEALRIASNITVDPVRALRHVTALGVSRAIRMTTRLPSDLAAGTPFTDTRNWVRRSGVEAFADQLALGGAGTAELARLITGAGQLFPSELVSEIARRDFRPAAVEYSQASRIVRRALRGVEEIDVNHLLSLPVSQIHSGRLHNGEQVLIRVRRPGIARQLQADAWMSAFVAGPLGRALPQLGALHPLGVVQLTARQNLEATDLRYEALGLIELGLTAEALGRTAISVVRPIPGMADERALVTESVIGTRVGGTVPVADPLGSIADLASLTLESALVHGVFWADPSPDHLLVDRDGRLVIVGSGTIGRLPENQRLAGILFLKSVLTGDYAGQVEAMRLAGAIALDADTETLVQALADAPGLQVGTMLSGGENGLLTGLNEAVRLLLAHNIRPPLDVILLLRTVFALGAVAGQLNPDGGGLMMALLPLFQRLPELIASAEGRDL